MLTPVPSCGTLPSLFGSEVSGDDSIKPRDAGGTCRAGHTAAAHQREYTCCVVGGSAHFLFHATLLRRLAFGFAKLQFFLNILNRNARPRIQRSRGFDGIATMPILHAFNFSRNNENQIDVLRGLATRCRKRCFNVQLSGRLVQYPSAGRHPSKQQYRQSTNCCNVIKKIPFLPKKHS